MMTVGAYEAKTRLAELLDAVERGETITITRHGVPVATLSPTGRAQARPLPEVFAEMREARRGVRVPGVSIPGLIAEGRRD